MGAGPNRRNLTAGTLRDPRGEEVFEQLHHIRPGIPIMVISGVAEEDVIGRFTGLGVVGLLKKPFGPLTLSQAIRTVLDQSAA